MSRKGKKSKPINRRNKINKMRTSNFVGTINTWAMTTLFLLVAVVVVHEVEVCAFQSWSSPPTSWKSQPAVSKNVQAMTRRLSNLEQRQQRFGVPRSTRSTASTVALQETASPVDYAYSPLSLDNSLTTVIAFFPTRDTQHQQAFTEAFRAQVMPVLNEEQGFVCSHLFQAVDGSKMALYEQWTSYDECIAAYAPTSRSTQVREQMKSVLEIDGKSVDRHVYEVVGWAENLPESENHVIAIDSRLPLVQFDAFATPTEEHQTHLLNLASEILPELMAREGIWSATFHRSSKNPLRVVKIGQWSTEETAAAGALQRAPYWEGVAENENHLYYLVASTQTQ